MTGVTPGRKEIHAEVTGMLSIHLANAYTLMLRLQNFHWNAEGPHFHSAHAIFEEFYQELWKEVDVIAERIRSLGEYAPGSFKEFFEKSQIVDRDRPRDIDAMYDELITCCVVVREHCSETLKTASLGNDEVTVDMLTKQTEILERAIWMFRSSLKRTQPATTQKISKFAPENDGHEPFLSLTEDGSVTQ